MVSFLHFKRVYLGLLVVGTDCNGIGNKLWMPSAELILERVQVALQEFGLDITLRPEGADTLVCIRVPPEVGAGGEDSPSVLSGHLGSSFHEGSSTDTPSVLGGAAVDEAEPWWLQAAPLEPGPHVLELHTRIRDGGGLSAVDRIRSAYLRGRQGGAIRRGEDTHFTGTRCTLRNRCYVVLAARHHPEPFFTWSVDTHQRAVRPPPGHFDHQAISHGFASQAEARAFCLGAGLPELAAEL